MRSVAEFCLAHGISRAFFYKLAKEGRGPRMAKVGRRTLISQEAAADWRHRMEEGSDPGSERDRPARDQATETRGAECTFLRGRAAQRRLQ